MLLEASRGPLARVLRQHIDLLRGMSAWLRLQARPALAVRFLADGDSSTAASFAPSVFGDSLLQG